MQREQRAPRKRDQQIGDRTPHADAPIVEGGPRPDMGDGQMVSERHDGGREHGDQHHRARERPNPCDKGQQQIAERPGEVQRDEQAHRADPPIPQRRDWRGGDHANHHGERQRQSDLPSVQTLRGQPGWEERHIDRNGREIRRLQQAQPQPDAAGAEDGCGSCGGLGHR